MVSVGTRRRQTACRCELPPLLARKASQGARRLGGTGPGGRGLKRVRLLVVLLAALQRWAWGGAAPLQPRLSAGGSDPSGWLEAWRESSLQLGPRVT